MSHQYADPKLFNMKTFFLLATSAALFNWLLPFQPGPTDTLPAPVLVKKWETDTLLRVPESVCFDAARKVLYVSNIDGKPGEKDGKGFISKLGLDGKIRQLQWVIGLDAPKGLGIYKNSLYVADLTQVVEIDIPSGTIKQRIPIEGSVFLNDITVDQNGVVYVSDSRTGKVHAIKDGKAETYLGDLKGPNGLLALPNNFFVLHDAGMYQVGKDKSLTKITDGLQGCDGVEQVNKNDYLVSCWPGEIYYVNAKEGIKEKLLDTKAQKLNTADIGYDAKHKIVYVPTFYGNKVVAYQLKN